MLPMWTARLGFWIDGLQAHDPHQALDPFAIHFVAQSTKVISHRATAPTRGFKILFINKPHQF